jgi:hypothetical protein
MGLQKEMWRGRRQRLSSRRELRLHLKKELLNLQFSGGFEILGTNAVKHFMPHVM